ncbi:MAG: hydroxyacid dehydrogenase [Fimbriimonadia bacterium]|nr:hydroxyacid dehydrogenase [Fimbriimonadia bacterium]
MKILIADKFEQSGRNGLAALGCEVIYEPDLKEDALTDAIQNHRPEALIVRSTKITAPMLESGSLSLVIRAGAGYNTIDVATASRCGIYVANCPGKNAIAVAELAFGLILALDRRIPDNVIDLRAGVWNKKTYSQAQGLFSKTLGLIGVGNIGQEMIARAKAFGLEVIAWSRSLTSEKARSLGVTRCESPLEVAQRADIVSVHVALTPDTRALCNEALFQAMKPGAFFINTSRAEVVDQSALERAIQERNIRAGLDVFEKEPAGGDGAFEDPIAQLPGVYGTHHIGASTEQAQEAVAAEVVFIIHTYLQTGNVPNVVNLCERSPATHLLVARHLDRVGVLAHIFACLREANINAQETENIVFEGAEAAIARIRLDNAPSEATLSAIRDHACVLTAHAIAL